MEEEKSKIPEHSELLKHLQNMITLRNGQDQVFWMVFSAFWTTNALLLISLFSVGKGRWTVEEVGTIISFIGIFVTIIWTLIQVRALDRIQMHENSIAYIEKKLKLQQELCAYSIPPDRTFFIDVQARRVVKFCCFFVLSLWIISFIIFLINL